MTIIQEMPTTAAGLVDLLPVLRRVASASGGAFALASWAGGTSAEVVVPWEEWQRG